MAGGITGIFNDLAVRADYMANGADREAERKMLEDHIRSRPKGVDVDVDMFLHYDRETARVERGDKLGEFKVMDGDKLLVQGSPSEIVDKIDEWKADAINYYLAWAEAEEQANPSVSDETDFEDAIMERQIERQEEMGIAAAEGEWERNTAQELTERVQWYDGSTVTADPDQHGQFIVTSDKGVEHFRGSAQEIEEWDREKDREVGEIMLAQERSAASPIADGPDDEDEFKSTYGITEEHWEEIQIERFERETARTQETFPSKPSSAKPFGSVREAGDAFERKGDTSPQAPTSDLKR